MSIKKYFDKNNLHHAYLIEGEREEILPELLDFLKEIGLDVVGNADISHMVLDSFKIDDARNLRSFSLERANSEKKKIFIISTNNFLLEAQNSLLKMFEEPIENTHFFLIVPDTGALLKTFVSRFYLIISRQGRRGQGMMEEAEKFLTSPMSKRIDFVKELTTMVEEEDEDGNEIMALDSARSKSLKFLNMLETVLYKKFVESFSGVPSIQNSFQICFQQIFKVREFLRMPGSSPKTLMESVALITPDF